MEEKTLTLCQPEAAWADEISAFRQEFLKAGSSMDGTSSLETMPDPLKWIQHCRNKSRRKTCPPQLVPATEFLYVEEKTHEIIGMINVRHELNENLALPGGHIGYCIRPSQRRHGYGTRMLKDTLPYCRSIGLERVLITCLQENTASARIIRAAGGKFESTIALADHPEIVYKRFWIDLSAH
jgi:predicted acetyltransferase